MRTTLRAIGLVYQIGHAGFPCLLPDAAPRLLTVMDMTGIHIVNARFCACAQSQGVVHWQQLFRDGWYPATTTSPQSCATMELLELYRRLKVIATVNVRDFVTTLENMTDPWGTEWTPDRYKELGSMSRQFSYLERVRRAGVCLDEGGLEMAAEGSLAVECWACPRLGVNLPANWQDVSPSLQ